MSPLRIAGLQPNLTWENPNENFQHLELLLNSYLEEAVDMIILPEMFSTGFSMDADHFAEDMEGEGIDWMMSISRKFNSLVVGSLIIEENSEFFNRLIVVKQDEIIAEYDKRHLFRMANEDKFYSQGTQPTRIEYLGWKISFMICYDLRFPVWSRNRHYKEGDFSYDLLIYVANWPSPRINHWDILLKARAIENQAYVIGINRVGKEPSGKEYNGHSAIIDPRGNILSCAEEGKEQLIKATLDHASLIDYRESFPIWMDADQFDLYV